MKKEIINKKSQVTIFIILAILIVAVIIILSYPSWKGLFNPSGTSEIFPRACIEKAVRESMNKTMMHGGDLTPSLYFMYNNYSLDYLCYTVEWYKTCSMQKPFLKQNIESEVKINAQPGINECINDMQSNFESRGYSFTLTGSKTADINLVLNKVKVSFNMSILIKKGEEIIPLNTRVLETDFNSKAYDLIMIASSIQNYEASYGDSSTESFMAIYPNIKVEKKKQSDGTKVYIITDRDTGERLQFATRSLAWPPGYAF